MNGLLTQALKGQGFLFFRILQIGFPCKRNPWPPKLSERKPPDSAFRLARMLV